MADAEWVVALVAAYEVVLVEPLEEGLQPLHEAQWMMAHQRSEMTALTDWARLAAGHCQIPRQSCHLLMKQVLQTAGQYWQRI